MRRPPLNKISLLFFAGVILFSLTTSAFGAATIVVLNNDGPGEGFNDPTPATPVGNNPGTTVGQQRLNAFQYAANIWGAMLNSNTTITIRAEWSALTCSTNTAVLGSAGANTITRDFQNAIFPGTWYPAALANALRGSDTNPAHEINATFNSSIGTPGCFDNSPFYLGLDNNHGDDPDLVAVLLHEFSHGLGFQSFTSSSSGQQFADGSGNRFPAVTDHFLFDNVTGLHWDDMTDAQRQASAIGINKLSWDGPRVKFDVPSVLATARLRVNSPGGIAGNYAVGTASFGARLSSSGVTADVVQALDPADGNGALTTDACSALTNPAAINGKIAFVDRGSCNFTVKVKNAQNAGAVGVIVANNVAGIIDMSGDDPTINIPVVMVSQADGTTIRNQLGAPVNATLLLDTGAPSGVDAGGRPLMFTPNPVQGGSSVSHWDTTLFPNQLMEPNINDDLTHSVVPVWDLTYSFFRDIGWRGNMIGDAQFFVRQHYLDFLNRAPDSSGLAFWTNGITSCGLDLTCVEVKRINTSAAFFLAIEFQETGYLVYRIYKSAYGNMPGAPVPLTFGEFLPDTQFIGNGVIVNFGNWQAQLEANKQAFALAFVQRARFTTAFPTSLTPTQFVDQLFANAGVTPSPADRTAAINEFGGAGNTADTNARARAIRRVAENNTLKQIEFNRAFVLMQYFGYLRRNPFDPPEPTLDYTGYNFWLTKLNQFNGDYIAAEMVKAFISSTEYRQRFGD